MTHPSDPTEKQSARTPTSPPVSENAAHSARVASGAGKTLIGRMAAFIELGSLLVFTWAYGAETFGLYAVLWSYVKIMAGVCDMAMSTALQRYVPAFEAADSTPNGVHSTQPSGQAKAASTVGLALFIVTALSCLVAALTSLLASTLTPYINAASDDAEHLVRVVQLYVWALPLWCIVELGTAAIRARRTFGPEIKVRIFYEQTARLVMGAGFAGLGFLTYGLFAAHLLSMAVAAFFALRLVVKAYGFKPLLQQSLTRAERRDIFNYSLAVTPTGLTPKLFSELPILLLNGLLPGAAGAAAGGYYSIARKLTSALQLVRLTFEYVMAPLAAEKKGLGDLSALQHMTAFSSRLALSFGLTLAATLAALSPAVLAVLPPPFAAALPAIQILLLARLLEAATGPSAAILAATGHKGLPLLNSTLGIGVAALLSFLLIPQDGAFGGVVGAALGAGSGIVLAAVLAYAELWSIYKLQPHPLPRPFGALSVPEAWQHYGALVVAAGALPLLVLAYIILEGRAGLLAAVSLLWCALTLWAQLRYGFSAEDADALGPIARKLRPKA